MAVAMAWLPEYRLDALIKALAAIVSVISAIMLVRLVPLAQSLPSTADLEREQVQRTQAEQQRLQLSNRLEYLVKERTARIERYSQSLERVAYIASHDLREPLHTVHTYTELLEHCLQGRLQEDEKHLVDFILSGSRRMQVLIDDLLEYTRVVKTTNLGDHMAEPTSLQEAAQEAISVLEESIRQSGADIQVEAGLPAVSARLAPLRQVFQNLIGNAIKYRRPGVPSQIQVLAEVSGSTCTVIVRDNGIGIDMRYASSIFEAFKRLHGPDVPGSGVGLALCKSIVESFGGTIWVDSEGPGTGSRFQFALPASDRVFSEVGAEALARKT
jgi:light-regulated signal transduction histidine kinase (bacteriophytochrome)